MNVNLWFAKDVDSNEIISVVNSNKENEYKCPICNSDVIPKAIESKRITPHFAHIDKSKCSSESLIHFWMKNMFIKIGESFTIEADKKIEYVCKSFKTEVRYELESGVYIPDIVVETECGNEIVFEMANTNKKQVKDYIDKWIELDKIVVEVDIKGIVSESREFKALYYRGKCFNFNKGDGGYFNSIVKLKEKMKARNSFNIDIAKKLDWFWDETRKYTYGETDIPKIVELLDILSKTERKFVIDEIIKGKCLPLHNEIHDYKLAIVKEAISKMDYDFTDFNINVNTKQTGRVNIRRYTTININHDTRGRIYDYIRIPNGRNGMNIVYDTLDNCLNTVEYAITYINNELDKELFIQDCIRSKELKHILEEVYGELDNDSYILSYKYKNYLSLELLYKGYPRLEIKLDKDNILDKSKEDLIKEIYNPIKNYVSQLESFEYLEEVYALVNNINSKIQKIGYSEISYYKSQRKFRTSFIWVNNKVVTNYNYFLKVDEFSQDKVLIKLIKSGSTEKLIWSLEINNSTQLSEDIIKSKIIKNISNDMIIICSRCGSSFKVNNNELNFFISKSFETPKRCKECRKKKRGE